MFNDEEKVTIEAEILNDVDYEEFEVVKENIAKDEVKRFMFYEKLRAKLSHRIPQNGMMNKVTDYLFMLPDMFIMLCRMMFEDRVDRKTKGFILGVISYVILPIDIIPDFIPIIGFVDDLIIVVFALDQILKYTDEQILIDNWSGKADLLVSIKNILSVVNTTVGQRILLRIKNFLFRVKP